MPSAWTRESEQAHYSLPRLNRTELGEGVSVPQTAIMSPESESAPVNINNFYVYENEKFDEENTIKDNPVSSVEIPPIQMRLPQKEILKNLNLQDGT